MKDMVGQKKIGSLIAILTVISMIIVVATLSMLYNSAFEQQRKSLIDTVKSQASLVTAIALYNQRIEASLLDEDPDYNPFDATINQLRESHDNRNILGETGEFTIAKLEEDQIVFLLNHRHHNLSHFQSISLSSPNAEPMRRALQGEIGTVIGLDYRGELVLAAYEPVEELGIGMVVKIDLSEIRAPFIRTGLMSIGIAILLVLFGVFLFFRIGNPLVRELIEKQIQLENITTTIPGCLYQFALDKNGGISFPYMSESIGSLTGVNSNILIEDATKIYDYIHHDDHTSFNESIQQSAETMATWELEFRVITTEKETLWFYGRANPSSQPDGSILWNGVLTDVTERKKVEDAILASHNLLSAIIESTPARVFWKDTELCYLGCNTAFANDAGMSCPEDLIGKDDFQMGWGDQAELYRADDRRVMDSGIQKLSFDEPQTTPDGHTIWLRTSKVPLLNPDGIVIGLLGIYEDITKNKEAEEDYRMMEKNLFQSEKLASVGLLAAGVAHEINNPIGYISSNLHTMDKYLQKLTKLFENDDRNVFESKQTIPEIIEDFHDAIIESQQGTKRVSKIVADLKGFSRIDNGVAELTDLNEVLESTLNVVWNQLKYSCKVEKELGVIPEIKCLPSKISQVFMNLLINAGHAIVGSGVITIKSWAEADNVFVSFRDDGVGIPKENLPKLFDAFFTTKEVGKGTGLGLSLSYDIVVGHGGIITVDSELGKGAEFVVTLPIISKLEAKLIPTP